MLPEVTQKHFYVLLTKIAKNTDSAACLVGGGYKILENKL